MFKLKEHGTTIKTEFFSGLTTFLTMVYIVPVNGLILSKAGLPIEAVITATALVTILATLLNGIWSNTPVAMSVGMGLNAYFSFGLVLGMKIPWQTALGIVFVSGIIFLILSFTSFRIFIINSIPMNLRRAIGAGIGIFIAFIGLKEMKIIVADQATLVTLGDISSPYVLIGIFGIILSLVLHSYRITGAFVISIIITSIIGWMTGIEELPKGIISTPASISPIAMKLDILSTLKLSLIPVIITFFITDLFDSLGTLTAIGIKANLFQKDSKILAKTLEADATATVIGSLLGVSTTTSFIESTSGVVSGGRTGLTAIFTALFFVLTLFMLPLFESIPDPAILAILVTVGILMFSELGRINLENADTATVASTFFAILIMPLTFSITYGISAAFISYTVIKALKGKFKDLNWGIILISIISLIAFTVHK